MFEDLATLIPVYRDALLCDVLPFWLKNSIDREYGGYFTCLERDGRVFDTDKFIWLQTRQVWTFSKLYNTVQKNPDWLECARIGAGFLRQFGRDSNGDWYFALTRDGRPLVQPYNIFSDCFAAMAFFQFGIAADQEWAIDLARNTYCRILTRRENPKGNYSKTVPGTRPLKNLALPMILCNLTLELREILPSEMLLWALEKLPNEILSFYRPQLRLLLENILPDGTESDCMEGRLVNPGHGIEAMWFIMDFARQFEDKKLIQKAAQIILDTLDKSWDKQYGGIFYFMDTKDRPIQQLEWDQKLWWVHMETLVALLKAFEYTQNFSALEWFNRIHDYTWTHFPDPQFGEWYGYLNRQGDVLLTLKGGKWKGCFHVPRGLLLCWRSLENILKYLQ
ncbi:AGE family epimerase/isomerase [candidate division KSB1 bacterium]|nr:AGE family epimerase/isomerase [candidate division KSB1 bacterium]